MQFTRIFSRPITPHITIYNSQITSFYSILHRFSGLTMTVFIVFFFILLKLYSYPTFVFYFSLNIFFINLLYFFITFTFFYHLLNGVRHINWDLGFNLHIKNVFLGAFLNLMLLTFYFIYINKNILT